MPVIESLILCQLRITDIVLVKDHLFQKFQFQFQLNQGFHYSQLMSEVQKEDLRRKNRESKKLARQKKKSSDSSSNKKSESSKAKIIQPYLCKDGKPYSFQRSPINFSMDDLEVSDDDDNTSYVGIPMKSPDISRRPSNRRCKIQN